MANGNKTKHIIHGSIYFVEHVQDHTVNSMEQAVKGTVVLQKKKAVGACIYGKM